MLAARQTEQLSQAEIENIRARERQLQWNTLKRKSNRALALRRDRLVMLAAALAVFALAFCYTFLETKIFGCGLEISNIKTELAAIEKNNEIMALNTVQLSSLDRIEPYAKLNLGMVFPSQSNIVYANFGGAATAAGPAPDDGALQAAGNSNSFLQALERLFGRLF
ncbi:MAG: hypothetical protein FWD39_00195 [Clostridiales bacterium]|nr:hypothetical protein [Clostridiales bacterium]